MTNTPWGESQYAYHHMRGCITYATASHGGIKVSPTLAKHLTEYTRSHASYEDNQGYWYEEDLDYLLPLYELQNLPNADFSQYRNVTLEQIKQHWEDYPSCQ